MTLWALALLAATPAREAFWQGDFQQLALRLSEARGEGALDPEQALFAELLGLLGCHSPSGPAEDLPRLLVRLEAARGDRVLHRGEARGAGTLWKQIVAPPGLGRTVLRSGQPVGLLRWPQEDESWPGEVLEVSLPRWRCADRQPSGGDELELVSQAVARLAGSSVPGSLELEARLSYHRAVLLYRAGELPQAFEQARRVAPAKLEPGLVFHAGLLRALGGERERWPELVRTAPADLRPAIRERACLAGLEAKDLFAAVEARLEEPETAVGLLCRATALKGLGRTAESLDAVARARRPPSAAWMTVRDQLSSELLAAGRPEWLTLERLQSLSEPGLHLRLVFRVAVAAIERGHLPVAARAAALLRAGTRRRERLEGLCLEVELAFRAGKTGQLRRALEDLQRAATASPGGAQALGPVVDLFRRLVLLTRQGGLEVAPEVTRALQSLVQSAPPKVAAELDSLATLLVPGGRASGTFVLVGQVAVPLARAALPVLPVMEVSWPEPYSLLQIPAPDGSFRSGLPENPAGVSDGH